MNDDIDLVKGKPKEVVRFDYLERLVRERRTVHRNLASHPPRRVLQCISQCRALDLFRAPPAKWAARRRQDDSSHLDVRTAGDTLQNCAVLTVDRHELACAACSCG